MEMEEQQELYAKQNLLQQQMVHQNQNQNQQQQGYQQMQPQMNQQFIPGQQQGQQVNMYNKTCQLYQQDQYEGEFNQDLGSNSCYASYRNCIGNCRGRIGQWCHCCCCGDPMQTIQERFVGLQLRFGKFVGELQAGLHYINPETESIIVVNKQKQIIELPKSAISAISKDNIRTHVDASLSYRIENAKIAVFKVENSYLFQSNSIFQSHSQEFKNEQLERIIYMNAETAIRTIFGQMDFQEIIEKKEQLNSDLINFMKETEQEFGIVVESFFLKEIECEPQVQNEIQKATAMVRQAKSNVINAEANVRAAQSLRKAADSLNSKAAIQIRFLNTLEEVCTKPGTRLMFYPKNCESFMQKLK
eukprot:TRINITY_DN1037_c0_g1_i3.p1 TRINITY_DN1037_c0_g1~~TRINITY_DN1037_c0_g1_i3.p1  ORF type:complete len:360 (-),score=80.23 TRINITY_DN1037_c0_g1_i3:86-1165(-)